MRRIAHVDAATSVLTALVFLSFCMAIQSPAAPLPQQMQQLREAHQRVIARMNASGPDGKAAELDDARMRPLLKEGWHLAGEWAADWLETHPGATSKAMTKLFDQFSPSPDDSGTEDPKKPDMYAFGGFAARIGNGVYVVASGYYHTQNVCATGTFWVIAPDAEGHLRPLWSVAPLAEQHFAKKDEIGRWAYRGCGAYYNGPLVADQVTALPAARKGELRFAVDATEATNGSTLLFHLSLWQWNGKEAENLLAGAYQDYIDDKRSPALKNDVLTLPTTEVTSSFASFGAAEEPRGEWRIRLTPDKVENLGHRFLNPQVAWLDALLTAVAAGRDASRMASPAAISQVQSEWKERNAEDTASAAKQSGDSASEKNSDEEPIFFLGFLYQFRATGPGSFTVKCDEARVQVTYRMRAGKPYITSVHFLEPD